MRTNAEMVSKLKEHRNQERHNSFGRTKRECYLEIFEYEPGIRNPGTSKVKVVEQNDSCSECAKTIAIDVWIHVFLPLSVEHI